MTTAQLVQVQALLTSSAPSSAARLASLIMTSSKGSAPASSAAQVYANAVWTAATTELGPQASPYASRTPNPNPAATVRALAGYTAALSSCPDPDSAVDLHAAAAAAAAAIPRATASGLGGPGPALAHLEALPAETRSIGQWLTMGALYRARGFESAAVDAFGAALESNAYALDAIDALAELGVQPDKIKSLLGWALDASPSPKKKRRAPARTQDDSDELEWSDDDELSGSSSTPPDSWLALYVDAAAAYWSHRFEDAVAALGALLDAFPHNSMLERRFALAQMHADDADGAMATFSAALAHDPDDAEGMDMYALLLFGKEEASTLNSLAANMLSRASDAAGGAVESSLSGSPVPEALRSLSGALPTSILSSIRNAPTLGVIAVALAAAENPVGAFKILDRALTLDPDYANAHIIKGRIALAASKYSARGSFYAAHRGRGGGDVVSGESIDSGPGPMLSAEVAALHEGRSRFPAPGVLSGLVEANMAIFEFRSALAAAKRGLELAPTSARALTRVAVVLGSRKEGRSKAIALLNAAIERNPTSRLAKTTLVNLYVTNEDYDRATVLLREKMQDSPGDSFLFHVLMAEVFTAAGNYNEALVHYHLALSVDPTSQRATEGLATLDSLISGGDDGLEDDDDDDPAPNASSSTTRRSRRTRT